MLELSTDVLQHEDALVINGEERHHLSHLRMRQSVGHWWLSIVSMCQNVYHIGGKV